MQGQPLHAPQILQPLHHESPVPASRHTEGLGNYKAGQCGHEQAVRGASTKDREVDRLESPVVRTFSRAGCQATHHVHLGPQVNVIA